MPLHEWLEAVCPTSWPSSVSTAPWDFWFQCLVATVAPIDIPSTLWFLGFLRWNALNDFECHWKSLYTESSAEFWGCNGFRKKAAIAAKARRKASSKNISMASKLLGGNGMWDVMGNVQNAPNRYKVLWKFAGEAAGVPLMLWNDWKQPDRNLAKAERKSSVGQILPAVLVAGVALCFYSFYCFTCPMCLFS